MADDVYYMYFLFLYCPFDVPVSDLKRWEVVFNEAPPLPNLLPICGMEMKQNKPYNQNHGDSTTNTVNYCQLFSSFTQLRISIIF